MKRQIHLKILLSFALLVLSFTHIGDACAVDDYYTPPAMFGNDAPENSPLYLPKPKINKIRSDDDLIERILNMEKIQSRRIIVSSPIPVKKPDMPYVRFDNVPKPAPKPTNGYVKKTVVSNTVQSRPRTDSDYLFRKQNNSSMPAVPAGEVDAQVLYLPDEAKEQAKITKQNENFSNQNNELNNFKSPALSIMFAGNNISLSDLDRKNIITQIIVPFQINRYNLIYVEAFTNTGDGSLQAGLSAKRISLQRAMALRSFLISRGVTNSRIKFRSFESYGKGNIGNRVDIYLK